MFRPKPGEALHDAFPGGGFWALPQPVAPPHWGVPRGGAGGTALLLPRVPAVHQPQWVLFFFVNLWKYIFLKIWKYIYFFEGMKIYNIYTMSANSISTPVGYHFFCEDMNFFSVKIWKYFFSEDKVFFLLKMAMKISATSANSTSTPVRHHFFLRCEIFFSVKIWKYIFYLWRYENIFFCEDKKIYFFAEGGYENKCHECQQYINPSAFCSSD